MFFSNNINKKWKELAEVRSRSTDTKVRARVSKYQSGPETSSNTETLVFDEENNGFAYYENGDLAVVVSKVSSISKKFFFYGRRNKKGESPLIAFVSELSEGFAQESGDGERKRLLFNRDGGLYVMTSLKAIEVINKWCWDPHSMNAGKPPSSPVKLVLNDCLECTFQSRDDITVTFQCKGLKKVFDCGLKLKRTDTYLDQGKSEVDLLGKVKLILDQNKYPSLEARCKNEISKGKVVKPHSSSMENEQVGNVMKCLEDFFQEYETRISTQNFSVSPAPDLKWKTDSLKKTRSEIPVVKLTGNEILFEDDKDEDEIRLVSDTVQTGKPWRREDGRLMNNLEIHEALVKENPVLHRPAVLTSASGRYSRQAQVKRLDALFKKLNRVRSTQFDTFLSDVAKPSQLVVVACLRQDSLLCRKAEQFLEKVNGKIEQEHGKDVDQHPYRIVKFEMSESNYLKRRYNIQSLPMYLFFYSSKLVYGGTLNGAPIHLSTTERIPPVLLLENVIKDQMQAENMIRKAGYEWDLALELRGAIKRVNTRRKAGGGFCVVMLSADMPTDSLKAAVSTFKNMQDAQGRRTLIALVHRSGTVPFTKGAVFGDEGKYVRGGGQHRKEKLEACLKTRIVKKPPVSLLLGAHVALQKPLTVSTMTALVGRWKRQKFVKRDGSSSVDDRASSSDESFMGLSLPGMIKKMDEARNLGRTGRFLKSVSFGTSLSTSGLRVCGSELCS